METNLTVRVDYLRIYDEPKPVTSTVNKVKSLRHGALILLERLPDESGELTGTKVIQLSAKQLNNLAGISHIKGVGKERWDDFAKLMQVGKSLANITINHYKKGDVYIDADLKENKHTQDGSNPSVNSIILPNSVVDAFVQSTIRKQLNYDVAVDALKDAFEVSEPVLDTK